MSEQAPVISGLPAAKCDKEDCFFCSHSDCFSQWICPHCKAHLAENEVCTNLCGLSYPAAKRFNEELSRIYNNLSTDTK